MLLITVHVFHALDSILNVHCKDSKKENTTNSPIVSKEPKAIEKPKVMVSTVNKVAPKPITSSTTDNDEWESF